MGEYWKQKRYNNRKIGARYEQQAADYLTGRGYRIVHRNYWTPFGEIDILAQKDGIWIFCEIKYRSSGRYGAPQEAVGIRKQQRISKAALYFYTYHGYAESVPCRFDVIAIYGNGTIEHIENAFEFVG